MGRRTATARATTTRSASGPTTSRVGAGRATSMTTRATLGGPWAARVQDVLNDGHRSDPANDTADFCDTPVFPPCSGPGNLRADYVLPRRNLQISGAGVFWPSLDPADQDPLAPYAYLVDPVGFGFPVPTSDH